MPVFISDRALATAKDESSYASGAIWPQNNQLGSWIGILPNVDIPPPEVDWKQYYTTGTDREVAIQAEGLHKAEGIELPITLQKGEIFRYVFDGYLNEASGSNRAHTFRLATDLGSTTSNDPQLRSLTLGFSYPSGSSTSFFSRYFTGARVNELTLSAEAEGELTATASFISAGYYTQYDAASVTTDVSTKPYLFLHGQLKMGTTTVARVVDFELTISNNLSPHPYVTRQDTTGPIRGGKYIYDLVPQKREFMVSTTIIVDTDTNPALWDRLTGGQPFATTTSGSPFQMELNFSRGTNDNLTIYLTDAVIKTAPHNIPDTKGEIEVPVEIQARKGWIVVHDSNAGNKVL